MPVNNPSLARNVVVATSMAAFCLAALSLGGHRAYWSSVDATVVQANGASFTQLLEVGVLKARSCGNTPCDIIKTPSFESCDHIGRTAFAFVFMGLVFSFVGGAVVLFGPIRGTFTSMAFIGAAALYSIALLTWSSGCHADLESAFVGDLRDRFIAVEGVTINYGIAFASVAVASVSAVATSLFLCCVEKEI